MWKAIKSAGRWLAAQPGWLLLTACPERLAQEPPARFARAWISLLVFSLAAGLASVFAWSVAWALFRDYDLLIMPALATVAVMVLGPLRRAVAALAEVLGGRQALGQAAAACLLVLALVLCLIRIKSFPLYGEEPLPAALAWLRPDREFYRVLFLMPLWGAWASMVAGRFCRPNERTEPAVAAFAAGCGPVLCALCMGGVMAVSILYFRYLPWAQLSISGAAILAAVAGGLALCRLGGGLSRKAMLAENLLTQLVFLLAYLANSGWR